MGQCVSFPKRKRRLSRAALLAEQQQQHVSNSMFLSVPLPFLQKST